MNAPSEVSISDISLAAYLLALGFPLVRTDGTPSRVGFVFRDVPEPVLFRFYGGQDAVSARRLFNALRDLKGLAAQRFSAKGPETSGG